MNPRQGGALLTRLRMEKWPQMSPVVDQTSGSSSGWKQQSRFMKLTMIGHASSRKAPTQPTATTGSARIKDSSSTALRKTQHRDHHDDSDDEGAATTTKTTNGDHDGRDDRQASKTSLAPIGRTSKGRCPRRLDLFGRIHRDQGRRAAADHLPWATPLHRVFAC